MTSHSCASGCMWTTVAFALVWLLGSSALLWMTWNRVVSAMVKVKHAKYWQALLLVTTIAAFCAPHELMGRYTRGHGGCSHHGCSRHHCCPAHPCAEGKEGDGSGKKEDCPYSSHRQGGDQEAPSK